MPLIRCDYSEHHFSDENLKILVKKLFDVSADLCNYSKQDAQNKISVFSKPFGKFDHSTASAEVEVLAKITEFDQSGKTRQDVRAEWLKAYESALIPLALQAKLSAPIIFTVTFQDWEVVVVSSQGSVPN
jgi:hypothetical protein